MQFCFTLGDLLDTFESPDGSMLDEPASGAQQLGVTHRYSGERLANNYSTKPTPACDESDAKKGNLPAMDIDQFSKGFENDMDTKPLKKLPPTIPQVYNSIDQDTMSCSKQSKPTCTSCNEHSRPTCTSTHIYESIGKDGSRSASSTSLKCLPGDSVCDMSPSPRPYFSLPECSSTAIQVNNSPPTIANTPKQDVPSTPRKNLLNHSQEKMLFTTQEETWELSRCPIGRVPTEYSDTGNATSTEKPYEGKHHQKRKILSRFRFSRNKKQPAESKKPDLASCDSSMVWDSSPCKLRSPFSGLPEISIALDESLNSRARII